MSLKNLLSSPNNVESENKKADWRVGFLARSIEDALAVLSTNNRGRAIFAGIPATRVDLIFYHSRGKSRGFFLAARACVRRRISHASSFQHVPGLFARR